MREYLKPETLMNALLLAIMGHIVGPLLLLAIIIMTFGLGAGLAFLGVVWWPVLGVFFWGLVKKERYAARAALPIFALLFAIPVIGMMVRAHIQAGQAQAHFNAQDHTGRISIPVPAPREYTVIDGNSAIFKGEKLALMRGDIDRIIVVRGGRDFGFSNVKSKVRLSSTSFSLAAFVAKPIDECASEDFDKDQLTYLLMKPDLPFCVAELGLNEREQVPLPEHIIFRADNPEEHSRGLYRGRLDREVSLTERQRHMVHLFVEVESSTLQWERSFGYPLALPLLGFNQYGFQFERKVTASKNADLRLQAEWGAVRGFSRDFDLPKDMYLQGASLSPAQRRDGSRYEDADINFHLQGFNNRKWGNNDLEALNAQGLDLIERNGPDRLKAHLISVNRLMLALENRSEVSFEGVPRALIELGVSLCLVDYCDSLFIDRAIKALPDGSDDFHLGLTTVLDNLPEAERANIDAVLIDHLNAYVVEQKEKNAQRYRSGRIEIPQAYVDRYGDKLNWPGRLPQ